MPIFYFSESTKRNKTKHLKVVCSIKDILRTSRKSLHNHCPEHLQYKPFTARKVPAKSDQAIIELRKRLNRIN